jgi:hypothetical protein
VRVRQVFVVRLATCCPAVLRSSCQREGGKKERGERRETHPVDKLCNNEIQNLVGGGVHASGGGSDELVEGFGTGEDDTGDGAEVCEREGCVRSSRNGRKGREKNAHLVIIRAERFCSRRRSASASDRARRRKKGLTVLEMTCKIFAKHPDASSASIQVGERAVWKTVLRA